MGSPRIQYLFWQWSRDWKIRTSLPHPWIFLDALKLVTSQSSNEVDFSSLCYHWPAGHIPAFLLGATHRPFPHSCKQRHQVEARVERMQWFAWNCPPEPRPHFFMFAHWSAMLERSISGIFIDKFLEVKFLCNVFFTCRRTKILRVFRNNGNVWKLARKCKRWTSLNFYAYVGLSYFASTLFTREKYQATVEIHPKAPYSALRFSWRIFYTVKPRD